MLGVAAVLNARFQESPASTQQDVLSLSLLQRHFEDNGNDCSDAAILMCLFRSLFDDFQGRVRDSSIHFGAAMQMIRFRGGPEIFRNNHLMTAILNCYDYRTRGYVQGTIFNPSVNIDSGVLSCGDGEVVVACDELLQFLHNAEHLSLLQKDTDDVMRHAMFDQSSVFSGIMSAPYQIIGSFPMFQLHATFGMSILLHFNVALWDFAKDSNLSELFLKDLSYRMKEAQLGRKASVAALAQFLLYASRHKEIQPTHFDRVWKVGRLLKIAKRLSATSWTRLWDNLLAYLTFEKIDLNVIKWEDDLRHEILQAPPTKLEMSILAESR